MTPTQLQTVNKSRENSTRNETLFTHLFTNITGNTCEV